MCVYVFVIVCSLYTYIYLRTSRVLLISSVFVRAANPTDVISVFVSLQYRAVRVQSKLTKSNTYYIADRYANHKLMWI